MGAFLPAAAWLPGRSRPTATTRVDGLGRAGLLLGMTADLELRLPADRKLSPWGRRRGVPGRLSSMAYQQAPKRRAPMKERL
jgi:hypothetical protein